MTSTYSKRCKIFIFTVIVAVALSGCLPVAKQSSWPLLDEQAIAAQLALSDHELVMGWVKELTSAEYEGRAAYTPGEDKAGDFIAEHLESFGLETWTAAGFDDYHHTFKQPGWQESAENIIGVLPGKVPNEYLLIGAHYDHLGVRDGVLYPGADDNAVGTAIVLELARIMSQSDIQPRRTVVFVLFGAEEMGLIGARELVQHLDKKKMLNQTIMLNIDVIAGVSGDYITVYDKGLKHNADYSNRARQEIELTGIGSTSAASIAGGVDSIPFAQAGVPALTLFWGDLRRDHPHLHQPSDTFENLVPEIVESATLASIRVAWAFAMR